MHYGKLLKNAMCAGLIISLALTAGSNTALSATMGGENQLAGLSAFIERTDNHGIISQMLSGEKDNFLYENGQTDCVTAGALAISGAAVSVSGGAVNVSGQAISVSSEEASKEKKSAFTKKGFSVAEDYVCIRAKKSTDSKILGKLYRGSIASIKKNYDGWVKVESGTVSGYVKKEYLAIGKKAEKLSDKFAIKKAEVQTETLMVREKQSTKSKILDLVGYDDTLKVIKDGDEWVKVKVDDDTTGYVSAEYVKVVNTYKKAEEMPEETEVSTQVSEHGSGRAYSTSRQSQGTSRTSGNANSSGSRRSSGSQNSSSKSTSAGSSSSNRTQGSRTGSAVASYALQFVGNPYVYGGTSLTNGADCSGFTQSVFRKFGVSLPRTSGSQVGAGRSISPSNAQAGDLIFYARNGKINHVAICIGNGRVVHASNPKNGIRTSNLYYRTPVAARRVI